MRCYAWKRVGVLAAVPFSLYVRFLRGGAPFASLERWQTAYRPAYSVWAAIVVVVFPPVFGFDYGFD